MRKALAISVFFFLFYCSLSAQRRHVFFVWADAQVYEDRELDYVREAAADMKALADSYDCPCFAVHCGDIIGEYYQKSPDFDAIASACESSGIRFHYVIGNHDLFHNAPALDARKDAFRKRFGKTYYSFDEGRVHYVVLDDVCPTGESWKVKGYIDDAQFQWLLDDLSKIRKGSTVVLFAHIPTWSREARRGEFGKEEQSKILVNRDSLYALLKPFNAHLMTGHEHYSENYVLSPNLMEHVHGPLSGVFWQSLWSCDGVPWGYYVYEVNGSDIRWYYKAVRRSRFEQFSVYDIGEDPGHPASVVVNVWNYDPQWKVEWSENGGAFREMTRFSGWDRNIVNDVELRRETEFKWKYVGAGITEHMFYATPSDPSSTVLVRVTDRFGTVYEWKNK